MKKETFKLLFNPFTKIAGWTALGWGVAGLAVSTVLCYYTHWHYHGLLHFGPAPNDALWCYAAEQATVWLIPALIFYIGGLILSKLKIRAMDVFGTTAFALLPLILMNLVYLLPPIQYIMDIDVNASIQEMIEMTKQPGYWVGVWLLFVSLGFLIWSCIWLFQAFKVSCNLKGYPLGILYCIGLFGGDLLARLIIGSFY